VWTKIGQCLEDSSSHCPFPVEQVTNRAGRQGQGRAGRPGKKTWEILGYGFQDMVFRTWDLNFGAWIFTLAVSETGT